METQLLVEKPEKPKAFHLAIYHKAHYPLIETKENLNKEDALAYAMEALKKVLEGKIAGFQLFEGLSSEEPTGGRKNNRTILP